MGKSTGGLLVAFDCNGSIAANNTNPARDAAVPFEVELDASLGQTSLGSKSVTTPGKSGGPTWTTENGSASLPLVKIQNFNVVANQNLSLAFNSNFTAFEQNTLYDYNSSSGTGDGTGSWAINLVTFAYLERRIIDQPQNLVYNSGSHQFLSICRISTSPFFRPSRFIFGAVQEVEHSE